MSGCNGKHGRDISNSTDEKSEITEEANKDNLDTYTTYSIKKDEHTAGLNFSALRTNSLQFEAIFDESAKYTLTNSNNQGDLNKLYGMSDCGTSHHTNSARFGWRWYNNELQLFAYVYENGNRHFREIASIEINKTYQYNIEFDDDLYVFEVSGFPKVELPRGCSGVAYGYKLFPYFGGNEVAPHAITIKIRSL